MNTKLVQYGIHEEKVDLRIHVGFLVRKIYVYKREDAIAILEHHPTRTAHQESNNFRIVTAKGHIVPVFWWVPFGISSLIDIEIPKDIFEKHKCDGSNDESTKGKRALNIVTEMLQEEIIQPYFPELFMTTVKPEDDLDMQIQGKDIIVMQDFPSIQVKCDYRAGPEKLGGTGNLFIQTHECNPFNKH